MSKNIEIEVRANLDKEEYDKILSSFNKDKTYTQTNYYIDNKSCSFSSEKYGLRIRNKNGNFELTLKEKSGDDYIEINQEITVKVKENMVNPGYFPSGEVKDYLLKCNVTNIDDLYIVCELKTTRIDIKFNDTIISLDKNEYLGIIDYNIECESIGNNNVEHELIKFLKTFDIEYKKSSLTKLQKALLVLKK